MPILQLDEFKARQRATWEDGDYSACSPYIADVGELVVERPGITPGMPVLDVACGTGNAARPARESGTLHHIGGFNNSSSSCNRGNHRGTHVETRRCKEAVMVVDEQRLNAFLGKAVGDLGAAASAALVSIGDELGFYKALATERLTPGQ